MKPKKPIESLILNVRNQKVILDADFKSARCYQTERCVELIAICDEFRSNF